MTHQQLPLVLTLSRILTAFPIAWLISVQTNWSLFCAMILFVAASITDYFDGYCARKYNAVTALGKFLDPVADKVLVTSALAMLLQFNIINAWVLLLFVGRDTIIGGIRSAASAEGIVIDAKTTGKWKAALQMISLPLLILPQNFLYFPQQTLGLALLWLSVVLSLFSGWQYLQLYQNRIVVREIKS